MKKILFVLLAITLVACNKSTKINKNLYGQGGDWEITYYSYFYGSSNPVISPFGVSNGSYENCGSFKFSKDGTGTMTLTLDGETEALAFKYSNTEDKLTLIHDGSYAVEYKMDWKKNTLTIEYDNDSVDPDGYNSYDSELFILRKKK